MCGILALLGKFEASHELTKNILELIDSRGPDYCSDLVTCTTRCGLTLTTKASVLHLRGAILQEQPVKDPEGNILMFNGQIYQFRHQPIDPNESDTKFLFEELRTCESRKQIANVISAIDGPFAFLYWHNSSSTLYYGRDVFGRKSLCSLSDGKQYPAVISSIAYQDYLNSSDALVWSEVDCSSIHGLDFSDSIDEPKQIKFTWNLDSVYKPTNKCVFKNIDSSDIYSSLELKYLAPLNIEHKRQDSSEDVRHIAVEGLEKKMIEAVSRRIKDHRFDCLDCRREKRKGIPVDICGHSEVAVAFSGGIDSTILALALDKVLDADNVIDLITVAFKENSSDRESVKSAYLELKTLCPDRKWRLVICDVSKEALEYARQSCIRHLIHPCNTVIDDSLGCACWFIGQATGRALKSWMSSENFVEVYDRFVEFNTQFVTDNQLENEGIESSYTSRATIFFVGSSIDEQLGGYSSHRAAWSKGGHDGLIEEISFLMRRISTRNLGRDDRVYSHHGRELKTPYLDSALVSYLNELPLDSKMNLNSPLNQGPKLILRDLALRWGLEQTARRVKKAMQFGTKIANLENSQEKGNDVCQRLCQR